MTPWLTFVIGVIIGLLAGWLIDLLYRRAPRPPAEGQPASVLEGASDFAEPPPQSGPSPELPGVAAASAAAAAVSLDDSLDVPPGSETAGAGSDAETVAWRDISGRVDEVASDLDAPAPGVPPTAAPRIHSDIPEDDDSGLPPSAVETLAQPPQTGEEEPPANQA